MANYPLVNFHFQVEWGGTNISFIEVSGLELEHDLIEYRGGASPEFSTMKIPGMRKYSNIILKQGSFEKDNEFFAWTNTIALSDAERRNITISLLNSEHKPLIIWKIRNSWPIALKFGKLNAIKNELLIERLEIVHEGLTIEKT